MTLTKYSNTAKLLKVLCETDNTFFFMETLAGTGEGSFMNQIVWCK